MENRLYRSKTEHMLGGVCGGLANYLKIDVTIVRLFFVAFTLLGGVGPVVYIILWIVLPLEGAGEPGEKTLPMDGAEIRERAEMVRDEFVSAVKEPNQNTARFIGIALVLAGGYLFLKQLHLPWLNWLDSGVIWAGLIVVAGVALLIRATHKE